MAAVTLTDVRKRYGKTEVVHGVSVSIADGEFIVIVGPSGCGKSTLLRMVAGLEEISEGTIEIAGRVVNDIEPTERNIAMVFQNYALYPHMSVFDNMAYGLKIARLPRAEIEARIDKAARMLQLQDYLDRKPRALSGGQRQRVAMGRALVREPAAFLLDEPLSNLDAKLRVQMRLEIRDMQRKVNTTTLYVTHDQVEAMTLADRLIVMNEGHVEQIDTPLAIYQAPATAFVATFIGSPAMNLWPAGPGARPGSVRLGGQLELGGLERPPGTSDWLMGVRPEHLEPMAADASADFIVLVRAMELLGADSLVHGHLEGQAGAAGGAAEPMPDVIVRVPGNTPVSVGDRLGLRVDRRALHWFDRAGGRRLCPGG